MGIAIATAFSSWINALLLYVMLKTRSQIALDKQCKINIIKIICATAIMLVIILFFRNTFMDQLLGDNLAIGVIFLLMNILVALIIFALMVFMLKIYSIENIKNILKKK